MPTYYNRIAGQSLHRLEGLSDGVFAVAMTLLVLDLHAPVSAAIHGERDLLGALAALSPRLLTYLMSFLTLGIFWVGQQTQHNLLAHSDRSYAWLNIAFLMAVTLIPFSTAFLADYITYRVALLEYWLNLLMIGVMIGACFYHASRSGLLKPDVDKATRDAFVRRVVIGQTLYALGAALCVFSTWWSIGFIVAVQLQYAIAPRFKPFEWL